MGSVDTGTSDVLLGQMFELYIQGSGVGQQTDSAVESIHDTDAMGLEFRGVQIGNVDVGEKGLGIWVVTEEAAIREEACYYSI